MRKNVSPAVDGKPLAWAIYAMRKRPSDHPFLAAGIGVGVPVVIGALATLPNDPSVTDRLSNGALTGLVSALVLAALYFSYGLAFAGPRDHRDAALAELVSARSATVMRPTPTAVERVTELVGEARALADDTKAGRVPPGILEPRTRAFREKATAALNDESPQHTWLFTHWKTSGHWVVQPEDRQPRYEHLADVAKAENMFRGLEEIERRLRAHAGEDIGPLSVKRALFGDLLLGAHHEIQLLHRVEAPIADFRAWDAELSRLFHLALPDPDADAAMDRSRYKPGRVRSGDLDDEALAIITITGQQCASFQTRLDGVTFRESFDPRDWHGRWT